MSGAQTIREAIIECFRAHEGGPMRARDVEEWVQQHYPGRWKEVTTDLADLTIGGNPSSGYRDTERCLVRVKRGVYRLDEAFLTSSAEPDHATRTITKAIADAADSEVNSMPSVVSPSEFWTPGTPATFATAAEKVWRDALDQSIPHHTGTQEHTGVILTFSLEGELRGGQPYDLDNLCEPVFSVLVNRKGWFGGHRTNIQWWCAQRSVRLPTGCRIQVTDQSPEPPMTSQVLFNGMYHGELPRAASDTRLAEWLLESDCPTPDSLGSFEVSLAFGTEKINLGDIATGPVKAVIDNLYPIIGGAPGDPEDWRINRLFVRKGITRLPEDAVDLGVCSL